MNDYAKITAILGLCSWAEMRLEDGTADRQITLESLISSIRQVAESPGKPDHLRGVQVGDGNIQSNTF